MAPRGVTLTREADGELGARRADAGSVAWVRALARRGSSSLQGEDGIALILAVLILAVMTITGTAVIQYTSSSSRSASHSKQSGSAYALAEAGVAEAMAVLSKPENNALDPYLLSSRTPTYPDGTITWSGTLNQNTAMWTITSTGYTRNPTGPGTNDVRRTITATVLVTPSYTQPVNNPIWNYIYAKRTGDPDGCDEEIRNSGTIATPLYVEGNLCIGQTTTITRGPLVVKGKLTLENPQNSVGSSGSPISDAHIGNGCQYKNNLYYIPCRGAPSYPTNVYAQVLDTVIPAVTWPAPDWDAWYLNANPGPYYPCSTVSGTPPTFDNDQGSLPNPDPTKRNGSVPGVFNLTPGASYTCSTAVGELSWNAATKVLTTRGTIFIDGSAKIDNGATNQYNGQAAIYLSGTLLIKNSKLCAGVSGSNCDTSSWNPNTELLIFIADGNGDGVPVGDSNQVAPGDSIQLVSADFQGGLMATNTIDTSTTANSDGPLLGDTVIVGQSVSTTFPFIDVLPAGAPGNPVVYAYPNPPSIYG